MCTVLRDAYRCRMDKLAGLVRTRVVVAVRSVGGQRVASWSRWPFRKLRLGPPMSICANGCLKESVLFSLG